MPSQAATAARAPKRQRISAEQRLIDDHRRATARQTERNRADAARIFPGLPVQIYTPFRQRACARNVDKYGTWFAHSMCRCTRCLYACPVLDNAYKRARGQ